MASSPHLSPTLLFLLVWLLCPAPLACRSVTQDKNNPDHERQPSDSDFESPRRELLDKLQRDGITDPRVLDAMATVPRHQFIPQQYRHRAYQDRPLPIGHDQTISAPFIVAFMTQAASPQPQDRVLEIGTGSGYQAAVISPLVSHVYTIEIIEELGLEAIARFRELAIHNVSVRIGDGYRGWSEEAPFHKILVTCAPDAPPPPLVEQLADGGRMIIPYGPPQAQVLYVLEKRNGTMLPLETLPVRFVPMLGEALDTPEED